MAAHKSKPRAITEFFVTSEGKTIWEVPLTQGKFALIDEEDLERIGAHNWSWDRGRNHARTTGWTNGRGHGLAMHRVILNAPPGQEFDHINGDGLDNRRSNLRLCTRAENLRNRRGWKLKPQAATRAKGVSRLHNGKYKVITVGTFDSEKEAADAYDQATKLLFGAFAKTNNL